MEVEVCNLKLKAEQKVGNRFQRWLWRRAQPIRGAIVVSGLCMLPVCGLLAPIAATSALVAHHVASRGALMAPNPVIDEMAAAIADSGCVTVNGTRAGLDSESHTKLEAMGLPLRLANEWHLRARLNFGRLDETEADKKCLYRWLGDRLSVEHPDLRTKDKVAITELVVAMYWVPRETEIIAQLCAKSGVATLLRAMAAQERA